MQFDKLGTKQYQLGSCTRKHSWTASSASSLFWVVPR